MTDWKIWRWILTGALTALAVIFLVPTFVAKDQFGNPDLPSWWKGVLPSNAINLGLDLQGGMHVDLEVGIDAALTNRLNRIGESVVRRLRDENVRVNDFSVQNGRLSFQATGDTVKRIDSIIDDQFYELEKASGPAAYKFTGSAKREISDLAVRQAIETIRNRIDQFGVREADVVRKGEDRIVIQLPGIQDPERALELIQNTAQLEFKLVETSMSQFQLDQLVESAYAQNPTLQTAPASNENIEKLNSMLVGNLPPGMQILFSRSNGQYIPVLVQARPLMTGESISNARVQLDTQFNQPNVGIEFNAQGADQFERVTGDNTGRQMAIVLDNIVKSAPRINERIGGGQAQITGAFTMDEARDLAIALRSGALPAPVEIAEKRVVGPTLGQDSIDAGIRSVLIAAALVIVFMFAYYNFGGLVANVALILNVVFILGFLSMFGATLTLPGVAGIVLTVGMAVDANVLIFERMREELRLGKSARSAVEAGYSKALWTIIDAQVTSLVAALVLFQFGTGPVKGFAVTLTLGIMTSIFTAVVVSKMLFDWYMGKGRKRTLNIGIKVPQPQAAAPRRK